MKKEVITIDITTSPRSPACITAPHLQNHWIHTPHAPSLHPRAMMQVDDVGDRRIEDVETTSLAVKSTEKTRPILICKSVSYCIAREPQPPMMITFFSLPIPLPLPLLYFPTLMHVLKTSLAAARVRIKLNI